LAEETGITEFAVTPGFAEVSRYTPKGERDAGCIKQVTLFLATVGDVTIEPSNEHAEFRWVPLQSALSLLQFDSLRTIFRTADESL
jgi:8-oxo-dGTP pyrophosphatase MutT (NUDIX family)